LHHVDAGRRLQVLAHSLTRLLWRGLCARLARGKSRVWRAFSCSGAKESMPECRR
jgi:hypothetical protein